MSQKEGYINFEEYSQVGEPQKAERAYAWSTAIGLQAVDGLTVLQYLKDTYGPDGGAPRKVCVWHMADPSFPRGEHTNDGCFHH